MAILFLHVIRNDRVQFVDANSSVILLTNTCVQVLNVLVTKFKCPSFISQNTTVSVIHSKQHDQKISSLQTNASSQTRMPVTGLLTISYNLNIKFYILQVARQIQCLQVAVHTSIITVWLLMTPLSHFHHLFLVSTITVTIYLVNLYFHMNYKGNAYPAETVAIENQHAEVIQHQQGIGYSKHTVHYTHAYTNS